MPQLLTDPAHWRLRAQQAHQLALRLKNPLDRAAKLEMADKYDRLAARATDWMDKTENSPPVISGVKRTSTVEAVIGKRPQRSLRTTSGGGNQQGAQ
jgi:hypothetical protein